MPRVVLGMALLRLDDSLPLAVGLLRVRASRCLTPRGGEASRINKKRQHPEQDAAFPVAPGISLPAPSPS